MALQRIRVKTSANQCADLRRIGLGTSADAVERRLRPMVAAATRAPDPHLGDQPDLYDHNGIRLANQLLADRNLDVVGFPVVGSPAQVAGHFRKPLGRPECPDERDEDCRGYQGGIGLDGLCREPWTLRYLPPAETVIDLACDEVGGPRRLRFIQSVPGGSAFLTAMQRGTIHGMEFATPLDDFDAARGGFFANASAPAGSDGRNLGEIGVRFAHYPAWHQPFFLGWMIINRSQVWQTLAPEQQVAIEAAAREAVLQSFEHSSSVQCDFLQRILEINRGRRQRGADGRAEVADLSAEMILTRWAAADLSRLREATRRLLEETGRSAALTGDQADYVTAITALYVRQSTLAYDGVAAFGKPADELLKSGRP